MWGSLTALTDNLKELTGKHQSDTVQPAPMLSGEQSTTDRWEEKKAPEAPLPELPSIDQQQTWKQPENPTPPEQAHEELLKPSAPVEQRRSSTVARKPLDSVPPTPGQETFPAWAFPGCFDPQWDFHHRPRFGGAGREGHRKSRSKGNCGICEKRHGLSAGARPYAAAETCRDAGSAKRPRRQGHR